MRCAVVKYQILVVLLNLQEQDFHSQHLLIQFENFKNNKREA
jgi:hypothetical protein